MIPVPANLAPVRPRVFCAESNDDVPLDEVIRPHVEAHACGIIRLMGSAGAGKTTALADLAARLSHQTHVVICENPTAEEANELTATSLVVYAGPVACTDQHLAVLHLAGWDKDELIEYLLAVHNERCGSVMTRLQAQRVPFESGNPEVWRAVLDQMAAEEALPDAHAALLRHIRTGIADVHLFQQLEENCLYAQMTGYFLDGLASKNSPQLRDCVAQANLKNLLAQAEVSLQLAVDLIVRELRGESKCEFLFQQLRRELIRTAALVIREDERAQQALRRFLTENADRHPMTASLLHHAGTGWVPGLTRQLKGAYLDGAAWPDVDLSKAALDRANLSSAYLCRANLDCASAVGTNFAHTHLDGASLVAIIAREANFAQAKLRGAQAGGGQFHSANFAGADLEDAQLQGCKFKLANLSRANFAGANLQKSDLKDARIAGADFSAANLAWCYLDGLALREATCRRACFTGAQMQGCDLEFMDLPGVSFANANLSGALLTGCNLSEDDFAGARLVNAGLAQVNLESACLRNADLRGVSFHLGGARSGMVFSPYPCEGSKTGFYTDEFEEQHFKAPDEIRKANLRGADLRGACLDAVDFYLVDLRDALYDPEHKLLLRRSGAILEDRR